MPIGHSSWHGKECNVQDLESVFIAKGRVTTFDSREGGNDYLEMAVSLDNYGGILGEGALVVIQWKLPTWSGCRRNDWCEEKII